MRVRAICPVVWKFNSRNRHSLRTKEQTISSSTFLVLKQDQAFSKPALKEEIRLRI